MSWERDPMSWERDKYFFSHVPSVLPYLREGITAGLTADIIEKLKVNGITRVTDLISKELEEICQLASISYKVIYKGNGFSRI